MAANPWAGMTAKLKPAKAAAKKTSSKSSGSRGNAWTAYVGRP